MMSYPPQRDWRWWCQCGWASDPYRAILRDKTKAELQDEANA